MRILLLLSLVLASCSDAMPYQTKEIEERALSESQQQAVTGLRTYCQACHGLGELKFLTSDDDQEVWDHLFAEQAPNAGGLWANEIAEVLTWPDNVPPEFDQPIEPGRDWMPKGAKRLYLADEEVDGYPLRQLILDELQAEGRPGGPATGGPTDDFPEDDVPEEEEDLEDLLGASPN